MRRRQIENAHMLGHLGAVMDADFNTSP